RSPALSRGRTTVSPYSPVPRRAGGLHLASGGGGLVGQVVLMGMLGVTTAVGLWLLGIPMALTLGLLTGVLELIPYIGAWVSAVPAALIALLLDPGHVLMVLALYLGQHILEGYLLTPLVQRRAVHVPPALTLVAQILLEFRPVPFAGQDE